MKINHFRIQYHYLRKYANNDISTHHHLHKEGMMTFSKAELCPVMEGLTDQALTQVAQYFAALAEPNRLRILNCLREGELNVGELAERCNCSQANVSRHLSTLAKHGFVEREGRGTTVFYRIADASVYALCDLVCGNVARQLDSQAALLVGLKRKTA